MLHRATLNFKGVKVSSEKSCGTWFEAENHIIEFAVDLHRKSFAELDKQSANEIILAIASVYDDEKNVRDHYGDVEGMYDRRLEEYGR